MKKISIIYLLSALLPTFALAQTSPVYNVNKNKLNASVAVGTPQATYVATPNVVNSNPLSVCRFRNTFDNPVDVSYDGSNTNVAKIASGATEIINYRANNLVNTGSFWIKYSTNPVTTGTLEINCN